MNKLKITLGVIIIALTTSMANAKDSYGAGGRYVSLDFYRLNCGDLTWKGIAAHSDAKDRMTMSDYNGAQDFLLGLISDYGIGGTCNILKYALPPRYIKQNN